MAEKGILEFKVVVLGDKGVGKTCLVLRFIEGYFAPKQQSTIGAFFLTKKIQLSDSTACKLQIWDTAGQERFRAMAPMYYRNASAAIVCFDITNEESFNMMKDWVEELQHNVPKDKLVLAIACNKADLEAQRVVARARTEQYARQVHAILYETSAKENFGVTEIFVKVSEEVVRTRGSELAIGGSGRSLGGATGSGGRIGQIRPSAGNRDSNSSQCC